MLEQSGKIKAKMPLFHPILFSYYGTFPIMSNVPLKTYFPFLLQNSYIWSHLQLRSWFCRQRIFTSSHSSWSYFQTTVWNCLFLSIQNSTTPVLTGLCPGEDCYISRMASQGPLMPNSSLLPRAARDRGQSLLPPPQWLCTALRIT